MRKTRTTILKAAAFLFVLGFICPASVRAAESDSSKAPPVPGIFKFFSQFTPNTVQHLKMASHEGKVFLFFDEGPFIPVDEGRKSFFRVWNGQAWEPAQPFFPVTEALSAGGGFLALTDGGYYQFQKGEWTARISKPEWKKPFGCVAKGQAWVFYESGDGLFKTTLTGGRWSAPEAVEKDWRKLVGPDYVGRSSPRAVFAFDRVWLFWIHNFKKTAVLLYKSYGPGAADAFETFGPAIQFSPVAGPAGITVFYADWQPEAFSADKKPSFSDLSAAMTEMQKKVNLTFYRSFDGRQWSAPASVALGQSLSIASARLEGALWLVVAGMQVVQYAVLDNGAWTAPTLLSGETGRKAVVAQTVKSPWLMANLILSAFFYVVFGVVVLIISRMIEEKKAVVLELGGVSVRCASLFQRFVAYSIDGALLYAVNLAVSVAWSAGGGGLPAGNFFLVIAGIVAANVLLFFGYFFLCEVLWGKTVGKRICGIAVVSADGGKAPVRGVAIRSAFRLLDAFFGHLVGAIIFAKSARHQRWGDMVGKTLVVRKP